MKAMILLMILGFSMTAWSEDVPQPATLKPSEAQTEAAIQNDDPEAETDTHHDDEENETVSHEAETQAPTALNEEYTISILGVQDFYHSRRLKDALRLKLSEDSLILEKKQSRGRIDYLVRSNVPIKEFAQAISGATVDPGIIRIRSLESRNLSVEIR